MVTRKHTGERRQLSHKTTPCSSRFADQESLRFYCSIISTTSRKQTPHPTAPTQPPFTSIARSRVAHTNVIR